MTQTMLVGFWENVEGQVIFILKKKNGALMFSVFVCIKMLFHLSNDCYIFNVISSFSVYHITQKNFMLLSQTC